LYENVYLSATGVLKLKSYWLKWALKATGAVTEGFLRVVNRYLKRFLKAAVNTTKKHPKNCLP
jgi:hypothetical protein